jgi:hypothetical protein
VTSARAPGPITAHLAADHERLRQLFARATAKPDAVEREAFDAFRAGLLRHIALEEKVLLPAARDARGGEKLASADRLRLDHGAIAMLLVPSPTPGIARELRTILDPHEELEERAGGVYAECEALLASRAGELVQRLETYPEIKVAAYFDGRRVVRTAAAAYAVLRGGGLSRE